MRRRLSLPLTLALLLSFVLRLGAQDVRFTDSAFSDSDWTAVKLQDTAGSTTFSVGRSLTGGHPEDYRRITTKFLANGYLLVGQLHNAATYTPATSGSVTSIEYSYDGINSDASIYDEMIDFGILLLQNGTYYRSAKEAVNFRFWLH